MAEESTPKRKNDREKDEKLKQRKQKTHIIKEPKHRHYKSKSQNNHRYNYHAEITPYKEKINPSTCHLTQMNWHNQPKNSIQSVEIYY